MDVKDRVRVLREALGLSQETVAARAGWHRTRVAKIERGDNKLSTADAREALAKAFGTDPRTIGDYVGGRIDLDEVLARIKGRSPSPPAAVLSPEPIVAPGEADSPLERALLRALQSERHTLRDVDTVRAVLRDTDQWQDADGDLVEDARAWLDAAARLRLRGERITTASFIREVTHGKRSVSDAGDAWTAEVNARVAAKGLPPITGPTVAEQIAARKKGAKRE